MLTVQLHPFPNLQTPRLLLRQMDPEDAADLITLRSDDRTMHFIGREKIRTREQALKFINLIRQAWKNNEGITWAICTPQNHRLIGHIGFWRILREHHRAEIGYMLHPDHWQQGLMSEALAALLAFGFNQLNLHSAEANVHPDNQASVRLLQKYGFVREGYFKENYVVRGEFQDTASYSLLRTAPAARPFIASTGAAGL